MATKNRTSNRPTKLERDAIYASLKAQGYSQPDSSVNISIHCIRKRRIDVGNTCEKAAIDGLVCAGVLPDDGPNQIEKIEFTQQKGQEEKTIIEIT